MFNIINSVKNNILFLLLLFLNEVRLDVALDAVVS